MFFFVAYIQEVGRAGRDGKEAIATLFYNNSDISTGVTGMKEEMRLYCNLTTCRREFLCTHFGFQYESSYQYSHQCCDNCEQKCNCDMCILQRDDMSTNQELSNEDQKSIPSEIKHSHQVKMTILDLLGSYFEAENDCSCVHTPDVTLHTGLSDALARQISGNYMLYKVQSKLQQDFPFLSTQVVENVSTIIKAICQQTETGKDV